MKKLIALLPFLYLAFVEINAQTCDVPSSLNATDLTSNSATLTWSPISNALKYRMQYRVQGTSTWTTVTNITVNSYNLTGINASTNYQFKVRSECSSSNSAYSTVKLFTTPAVCQVPTNLAAASITFHSATLSWDTVSGAASYNIQYAFQNTSNWTTVSNITSNSHGLTGLNDNTAYQFKVRAECGGVNYSDYATAINFATPLDTTCYVPTNIAVTNYTGEKATVSWGQASNALTYALRYVAQNRPDSIIIENISSTSNQLTGLNNETTYYIELQSNCANNVSSSYSIPISFTARNFRLSAKGFYTGNEALVRWAPLDFESWKWGNEHGYKLERMTMKANGVELGIPQQLASITVLDSSITAFSEAEFEPMADTSDMAGIGAGLIYGDSLEVVDYNSISFSDVANLSKERDIRFGLGLFAADNSFEVAVAMGLGFTDQTTVQGNEYLYIVKMNGLPPGAASGDAVAMALASGTPVFPAPQNIHAIPGDMSAIITWDKLDIDQHYSSYSVEKSSNGGASFEPAHDLPLIFTSSLADAPSVAEYFDSLAANGVTYIYRVRGKTPYDLYGPYSDTIHVIGKPGPIDASIVILRVEDDATYGDLKITWDFPAGMNGQISGFDIYRTKSIDSAFVKINTTHLPTTQREYIDPDAKPVNFYKITAKDINDYVLSSNALLGQPKDTIAPSAPVGLTGTCDRTGKVTIEWPANTEPDLMGYRVFMANAFNGEFTQITGAWINNHSFSYNINLKTLTEKVYFAVKALDYRENASPLSVPVEVARPDVIPPAPPVISSVVSEPKKVNFEWVLSSSTDVVEYVFQRKQQGTSKWLPIHSFSPLSSILDYADTTASHRYWYNYRLLAKDEAGLTASSKIVKAKPVPDGIRDSITNFTGWFYQGIGNISSSHAVLRWDYVADVDLLGFQIYRGIDTNDLRAFKFITVKQAADLAISQGLSKYAFLDTDMDFANVRVQDSYTSANGTITNAGGNPFNGPTVYPISPNVPFDPHNGTYLTYKVMAKFYDGGASPLSLPVNIIVPVP